jgi:hypothetical protein
MLPTGLHLPTLSSKRGEVKVDLTRFKELKEKGSTQLQRLGPNFFQLVSKQFDPANGKELTPEVINCNAEGVAEAMKQAQAQLKAAQAAVDSLITLQADMVAAEEKSTGV